MDFKPHEELNFKLVSIGYKLYLELNECGNLLFSLKIHSLIDKQDSCTASPVAAAVGYFVGIKPRSTDLKLALLI